MLIIDKPMPKNCDECIFATDCSFCEGYDDHCVLNDGNAEIGFKNGKEYQYWDFSCEIIPKERPSWCPIKGEISEIELMHLEEERAFAARNIAAESEADADYQLSVLMQEYFERYEPTYNSEDGSM